MGSTFTTSSTVCATKVCFPPSRYTGKERDAESGNDYFGARYYASSMGRFMSPDWAAKASPVPYAAFGDPQSLNLYSYVRNNPLSKADSDGHCDWCFDVVNAVATYVAVHPAVAQALGKLGDSLGMKISAGGVARIKEGNANVGFAASITSEGRNDGTGKSALQGTGAASIGNVGGQFNVTGTFEKNGTFQNPLDNIGGNAKLTGSGSHGDNVNSNLQAGDDGRVAVGAGFKAGLPSVVPGVELQAQAGVQVTAGGQQAAGVARAVGDAAISDTKQYAHDLHESTTCGTGGCARPQ